MKIVSYYYSDKHLTPDVSFDWISTSRNTFTIDTTPGTIYIWVRDSKGNISNAVSGTVFDTVTTDTTVKNLSLYDKNGKLQTPTSSKVSYLMKSSNYVKLSNDLVSDSDVLADAFNPFDMEYKLEVDSPTISVYATLTSNDSSYVSGYEPRTVNLDYGLNTILIKIKNKEGKVRTYTILVTRTDDRTSDNTLKDININVGNINFDPNVTDYKIEIPESVKTVNVKALISNNKANYISGYEDGSVKIDGDSTVKLIKVKSETGSTRTYILTFIKKGTDNIINKSLQLNDLVIPGINIPFEESVSNYSLSVDYEINKIDVKPMLKDSNSRFNIKIKRKNETNYQDVSRDGISLDVGENFLEVEVTSISGKKSYYRLTIIRKEYGLEVSNDVKLKDLKVLGYDIKFEPNKKDYTVKIKQEKSLVITAIPNNSRAEVFIRGNNELTGFSTVRINVVAENGEDEIYSIDIKKDVFNQVIEVVSLLVGSIIIIVCSSIIIIKKNRKSSREYYEE